MAAQEDTVDYILLISLKSVERGLRVWLLGSKPTVSNGRTICIASLDKLLHDYTRHASLVMLTVAQARTLLDFRLGWAEVS